MEAAAHVLEVEVAALVFEFIEVEIAEDLLLELVELLEGLSVTTRSDFGDSTEACN